MEKPGPSVAARTHVLTSFGWQAVVGLDDHCMTWQPDKGIVTGPVGQKYSRCMVKGPDAGKRVSQTGTLVPEPIFQILYEFAIATQPYRF